MLRLLPPYREGQEKRPSKERRTTALAPTKQERTRIRAAIRNIARAYGGRDVLAAVIGVNPHTLSRVHWKGSLGIAVRVAQAAGIPVEQILSGKPHEAGTCALCGARKGAK